MDHRTITFEKKTKLRDFFKEMIEEKYIFETGFLFFSDSFIFIMAGIFSLPIRFREGTMQ